MATGGAAHPEAVAGKPDDTSKVRQEKARAARRALDTITRSNCQPQDESPLLTLPTELRLQIYQLVLSQQVSNCKQHVSEPTRPGHTHYTTFDLSLLRTCRLIYAEARMIPMQSATHHPDTDILGHSDYYLHHLSRQQGLDLYHLHDEFHDFGGLDDRFRRPWHYLHRFLLPHLHWKRISWTISTKSWDPRLGTPDEWALDVLDKLRLSSVVLPASCSDVTLELESRHARVSDAWARQVLALFSNGLKRSDGAVLKVDVPRSFGYVHKIIQKGIYFTVRICFAVGAASRRQYVASDHWDCLGNLGPSKAASPQCNSPFWAERPTCQYLRIFDDLELLQSDRPIFGWGR